jgi:hypothetical protein
MPSRSAAAGLSTDVGHDRDPDHRREVAVGVIGHLRVEVGVDRVGGHRAHHDRVTIGRRLGHEVGADVAPGTRTISTITGWPRGSRSASARARAIWSSGPPGG